jgi:hypothetical protein
MEQKVERGRWCDAYTCIRDRDKDQTYSSPRLLAMSVHSQFEKVEVDSWSLSDAG